MSDSQYENFSALFGICINHSDFNVINLMKWLMVVGTFYIGISLVNGYYKNSLINGHIIRYASYKRWLNRYFYIVTTVCFSISCFYYLILVHRFKLDVYLYVIIILTVNFVFKALLLFWISSGNNYNIYTCVFLIMELIAIYSKHGDKFNPFTWSMFCKSELFIMNGFDLLFTTIFEMVTILVIYIVLLLNRNNIFDYK